MDQEHYTTDVLIAGTGAAGLTAAITARKAGLNVLVVEKEPVFGGTTATSSGGLWIPSSHHSAAVQEVIGRKDHIEEAYSYLIEVLGDTLDRERVEAYLSAGPEMVHFLENETEAKFFGIEFPDYQSESKHASVVRTIVAADYVARRLGESARYLKRPLPQMLFLGLAVGYGELNQFLRAARSIDALRFTVRKLGRHFLDVARFGKSQHLAGGCALVARLARTLFDLGIPLWLNSPVQRLTLEGSEVTGAEVCTPGGVVKVTVRRGVVLACGGFPNDPDRRASSFPGPAASPKQRNPVPPGNNGDGIRLAESVGGQFDTQVAHPAAWMPVSVLPGSLDYKGVALHLVDRQKPGFLAVLPNGRRFGNESSSYHDLAAQLIRACPGEQQATAWLIGDRAAVKRWGIGMVRPFPLPHGRHLRSGYLLRAPSLRELGRQAGIDSEQLERTIAQFNEYAHSGVDLEFGRGGRLYDIYQGDAQSHPSPCLGPLKNPPFYAVRITAGIIGTFAGIKTDRYARVLDHAGCPIFGLYAVGNDQASVFAGTYPGAGATLGPGMTFAYIAARHLAGVPDAARDHNRSMRSDPKGITAPRHLSVYDAYRAS